MAANPQSGLLQDLSRPINRSFFDRSHPKEAINFGDYIRKCREDKGVLSKDFAKMPGVSEETVIHWELRGIMPGRKNSEMLKKVFPGLF
jgi:DNA-binding transcriptional regulator YiaG